jgi:hypothetical protein
VELVGLIGGGKGELQKVYDLKLGNVTVASVLPPTAGTTPPSLRLRQADRDHQGQNPDGSLNAGQTFSFNLPNGKYRHHDAWPAFAHSHDDHGAHLSPEGRRGDG